MNKMLFVLALAAGFTEFSSRAGVVILIDDSNPSHVIIEGSGVAPSSSATGTELILNSFFTAGTSFSDTSPSGNLEVGGETVTKVADSVNAQLNIYFATASVSPSAALMTGEDIENMSGYAGNLPGNGATERSS